ncbi:MAG: hypothetical protein WCQ72_05625 [Eubacteriales bacterium]
MKIDWRRKLSSRKFWAAAAGFITALLAAFGAADMTTAQITAVVTAVGVLAAYILGEGIADGGASGTQNTPSVMPDAQNAPEQSDRADMTHSNN